MTVSVEQSSRQEAEAAPGPASVPWSVEEFVNALRYPHLVFGPCADPDLEARNEEADWDAALVEARGIFEVRKEGTAPAMRVLSLAAGFLQRHGLRLHGAPWLSLLLFEEVASIRYRVHLDVDEIDAWIWNERLLNMLADRELLGEGFSLEFRTRGPR